MNRLRVKQTTSWFVLGAFVFPLSAVHSTPEVTLDDLRKLEIICFVPSYLPKGFRLQRIDITYDEVGPDENKEQHFPLYSVEYGNAQNASFSIESAREGIGDRNIMEEENTEETEIQTPLGPTYLIYRPKEKSALKIHPKVFSMINCWISDSESPVVTEINLDAVEKNGNEFNQDGLKQEGEWLQCPVPDTNGFMRYRVLESKGNHYKVEFQENGGGTLTTSSIIEFGIEERNIQRNGKPATIRVLRVSSYDQK
jgi:hypothetical protein